MFNKAFEEVLQAEGGFSNDPNDPGNWTGGIVGVGTLKGTKYGISAASYPNLNIRELTINEARNNYYYDYWMPMRLETVLVYSDDLADMLFNLGVNCGRFRGIKFLQTAINTLNFTERLEIEPLRKSVWQQKIVKLLGGAPLKVDGVNGPCTQAVLYEIPHQTAVTVAVFGEAYKHYARGKLMYRAGWLNRLGSIMIN